MSTTLPPVTKGSCQDCLLLEQGLSQASEYFVTLIVQHDQMIRDGDPQAILFERMMRKARRRRTAAARRLLTHRQTHEARSKTLTAGDSL